MCIKNRSKVGCDGNCFNSSRSNYSSYFYLVNDFSALLLRSRVMFNLWSSSPTLSLNSIAYRRVICVYQYQVADDLSGRSMSFKWFGLLLFLTHAVPCLV